MAKEKLKSLDSIKNFKGSKKFYLIILLIGLLLLATRKGLIIAALVNGQPISNLELQTRLNRQFRDQTLTQMINEKILQQEAAQKGITVTSVELDQKIKTLEAQYGGTAAFNSLLAQQGITREDFLKQTKLQLIVEKLYTAEASPSGEEVEKFMIDNKDVPEATQPAKFRETAFEQIKQQKLTQIFNQKFQELRSQAKIQIF